jgi:hypothetical protein
MRAAEAMISAVSSFDRRRDALEDDAPEGGQHRFAGRTVSKGVDELLLEDLHAAVEEVFLGREVVEDGPDGDACIAGDLCHSDRVESALGGGDASALADAIGATFWVAVGLIGATIVPCGPSPPTT